MPDPDDDSGMDPQEDLYDDSSPLHSAEARSERERRLSGGAPNPADEQQLEEGEPTPEPAPEETTTLGTGLQSAADSEREFQEYSRKMQELATELDLECQLDQDTCTFYPHGDRSRATPIIVVNKMQVPQISPGSVARSQVPPRNYRNTYSFPDPSNPKVKDVCEKVMGNYQGTLYASCTDADSLIAFINNCGSLVKHLEVKYDTRPNSDFTPAKKQEIDQLLQRKKAELTATTTPQPPTRR